MPLSDFEQEKQNQLDAVNSLWIDVDEFIANLDFPEFDFFLWLTRDTEKEIQDVVDEMGCPETGYARLIDHLAFQRFMNFEFDDFVFTLRVCKDLVSQEDMAADYCDLDFVDDLHGSFYENLPSEVKNEYAFRSLFEYWNFALYMGVEEISKDELRKIVFPAIEQGNYDLILTCIKARATQKLKIGTKHFKPNLPLADYDFLKKGDVIGWNGMFYLEEQGLPRAVIPSYKNYDSRDD